MLTAQPLNFSDDFTERLVNFYKPFDLFLRHYQGCQDKGFDTENICRPGFEVLDTKNWNRAREAAKKLFSLQDIK